MRTAVRVRHRIEMAGRRREFEWLCAICLMSFN